MGFTPKQQKLFDAIRKMKADGLDDTRIREFVDFAVKKDPELSLEPQEAVPQPKVSLAPPKPTQMRGALGAIEAQAEERGLPKPSTVPTGTMPDITKQEGRVDYLGRFAKDFGESVVKGFEQVPTYLNPFSEEGRMMGEVARMGMANESIENRQKTLQDYPRLATKSGADVFTNPSDLDAWTAATANMIPTVTAAALSMIPAVGPSVAGNVLGASYMASSLSDNYAEGLKSGLTDNQATAYGTIMGSIEAAFEKLGFDKMVQIPKSWISKEVKEAAKQYGKEGAEQGIKAVMAKVAKEVAKRGAGFAQGGAVGFAEEAGTSLGQSGTQLAFDAATGGNLFDPNGAVDNIPREIASRALSAGAEGILGQGMFGGIRGIDTRDDIDPVPAIATTEERQAAFVPPDVPPANPLDNVPPTTPPVDDTPMAAMTEATDEAEDALTALADDLSQDNVVATDVTEVAEELPLTEAQKRAKETLDGYKSVGAFDEGQLGLMQPLIEQLEDIADEVAQLDKVTKADKLGLLKEANTAKKKGIEKRKKEIEAELKRIASTPTVVTPVVATEEDVAVGDDDLLGIADDLPAVEDEPVVTPVEPALDVEESFLPVSTGRKTSSKTLEQSDIGKKVTYNGQIGIIIDEGGGKFSVETPTQIIEIDTELPLSKQGIRFISEKTEKDFDKPIKVVSENEVLIADVPYSIVTDNKGNTIYLTNGEDVIQNEDALVTVDVQRSRIGISESQEELNNQASIVFNTSVDVIDNINTVMASNMTESVAKLINKGVNSKTTDAEFLAFELYIEATIADLESMFGLNPYAIEQIEILKETQKILDNEYDKFEQKRDTKSRAEKQRSKSGDKSNDTSSGKKSGKKKAETPVEVVTPQAEAPVTEAKKELNQKPNTDEKANEEPLLEGLRDGGQQDQGRQESPELRPQEAQGQVTAADFAAIEAKGQAGRKARQALSERVGKDVVADMTRITAKFESIITALEKEGKIRKQCP